MSLASTLNLDGAPDSGYFLQGLSNRRTGATSRSHSVFTCVVESRCKVSLELGGNAPSIICYDANLDVAVRGIFILVIWLTIVHLWWKNVVSNSPILKDEATREQYDYAIVHPEEVDHTWVVDILRKGKKECFASCLFVCYDLICPDFALKKQYDRLCLPLSIAGDSHSLALTSLCLLFEFDQLSL
nr:clathrin heavy chain 1 [Ipomoea batatas]